MSAGIKPGAFRRLLGIGFSDAGEQFSAALQGEHWEIAFDLAKLQSAGSFIEPVSGLRDARADGEFIEVIDAYCNGAFLTCPLPGGTAGEEPLLLSAWPGRKLVRNREFDSGEYAATEPVLTEEFVGLMATDSAAEDACAWVCFQFTDAIAEQYWNRGGADPIRRAAAVAVKLLEGGRLDKLNYQIRRATRAGALRQPAVFSSALKQLEVRDLNELAVAYLLSVFTRGWSYAATFEGDGSEVSTYSPFWLRDYAIRARPTIPASREGAAPSVRFPWGMLLLAVLGAEEPVLRREWKSVIDTLQLIREDGQRLIRQLCALPLAELGSSPGQERLTEGEEALLLFLATAGIAPRLRGSAPVALARAATALPAPFRIPALGPEKVSWVLNHTPVRKAGAFLELTFRRERFWEGFELPGVRESVRAWANAYSVSAHLKTRKSGQEPRGSITFPAGQ